jgi:SagB-type dehydrogenase family enzyme
MSGPTETLGKTNVAVKPASLLAAVLAGALVLMMQGNSTKTPSRAENASHQLPTPQKKGGMSVAEALARRRSQREFADRALSLEHLSQLCWAAQGITDQDQGYRTAPSAGALYPVSVFLVDRDGVYEYEPRQHVLRQVTSGDPRKQLQAAALDQPCVGAARLCLVIAVDVARSASKYGRRAERYCLLEAGHVAQNILLQGTALGLGGVPVGAFDDRKVASILHLPQHLTPVYLLPLGFPPEG